MRKHLWAARLTKDCIVPFFDWFPMVSAQAVRTYGKNIWIAIVLALNKTLLMRVLVLKLNFSNEIVKVGNTDFHCNENWQSYIILLLKCQRQLYNVYTRPFCVKTTHVCLNRWKPNIDSMTCIELFTLLNSFPFFSKIRNPFSPQTKILGQKHLCKTPFSKDGKNESFWMIMSCRLKNVDYSGKRVTNNLFCSRRAEGKERLLLLRTSDETTTSTDISTALL